PWITGSPEPNRHPSSTSEGCHKFENRLFRWEVANLLNVDAGVIMALIGHSIGITLQIGESKSCSSGRSPLLFLLMEFPIEERIYPSAFLDGVHQFSPGASDHET